MAGRSAQITLHPQWVISSLRSLEGGVAERVARCFFSYHYVFLISVCWALCLNIILQTVFHATLPALEQLDLRDVMSMWRFFIAITSSVLLCIGTTYIGSRAITVVVDCMVVDGWRSLDEKHSSIIIDQLEEFSHSVTFHIVSLIGVSFWVHSLYTAFAPVVRELPEAALAVQIIKSQCVIIVVVVARNLPSLVWCQFWDATKIVKHYCWGWLRWSTLSVLALYVLYWAITDSPFTAVPKLSLTTILLISPHVIWALTVQMLHRIFSFVRIVLYSLRETTSLRWNLWWIVAAVVAFLASMAVHASRTYGAVGIVCVLYTATSLIVGHVAPTIRSSNSEKDEEALLRSDSTLMDDIPRRMVLRKVLRGILLASVVVVVSVVVSVVAQHSSSPSPLQIRRFNRATRELETEHLHMQLSSRKEIATHCHQQRDVQTSSISSPPALCEFRTMGLNWLDLSWMAFLAYFDETHPNYKLIFDVYRSGRCVGDDERALGYVADWELREFSTRQAPPEMKRQQVHFVDIYSRSRNLSVISVRGTDIGNHRDILQDISIHMEVFLFDLLFFVVPGFSQLHETLIVELIAMTSRITQLVEPSHMYYWHRLSHYVSETKQNRNVLVVGHSLGGMLSKIAGVINNVPVFAISSPGTLRVTKKYGMDSNIASRRIVNLIPDYDLVASIDRQVGVIFPLPCQYIRPDLCHLLEYTIASLWNECPTLRQTFSWHNVQVARNSSL